MDASDYGAGVIKKSSDYGQSDLITAGNKFKDMFQDGPTNKLGSIIIKCVDCSGLRPSKRLGNFLSMNKQIANVIKESIS